MDSARDLTRLRADVGERHLRALERNWTSAESRQWGTLIARIDVLAARTIVSHRARSSGFNVLAVKQIKILLDRSRTRQQESRRTYPQPQ